VRGFYWRAIKYEEKMKNPNLGMIFQGLAETMARNWRRQTSPFYLAEAELRGYLLDNGIPIIKFPFYLSFVRKALMLFQNYKGETLTERINSLINTFIAYGLEESHLRNIISNILHRTPPITP